MTLVKIEVFCVSQVGAGPSGLVLALSLLKNGIPVRIIEKEFVPMLGERGAGVTPRSLELHKILGTYDDIIGSAVPIPAMRKFDPMDGTKVLTTNDFATIVEATPQMPITTRMMLGQHYQERIFRSHLGKLGGSVEFGSELRSFTEDSGGFVTAKIIHHHVGGEDTVEEVKTLWLIGCDGGHSIVRKTAGLGFSGETKNAELALGDIKVKSDIREFWDSWGDSSTKTVYLRPSGQKDGIVQFVIGGSKIDVGRVISSREAIVEEFYDITGRRDIVFGEVVWSSRYRPNIRVVEQFRLGRVLIVGDAAHSHSPAGGQGMNSSIQDSINLGWKLALVCKGYAPPSLLDTYGEERLPVISEMIHETTKLWDQLLVKGVQSIMSGNAMSQLGVNCRGSSIVYEDDVDKPTPRGMGYNIDSETGGRPGDRAPGAPGMADVKAGEMLFGIYDIFSPFRHTILVFSDPPVDHMALSELIKTLPLDTVRSILILPKGAVGYDFEDKSKLFDQTIVDTEGHAYSGYHVDGPSIAIVRPDGVIGARVRGAPGVAKYFAGILHQ